MATMKRRYWQFLGRKAVPEPTVDIQKVEVNLPVDKAVEVDIAPDDPLLAYLLSAPGVVEVQKLALSSRALDKLKAAGVTLIVPLVSQGELIGVLNLGPRLSEQEYSSYDLRLLNNLATQAAPALRVAQLARQQQAEARERERMEQELRVARVIQQTLLPKEIPQIEGWQLAAHWQPARAVSGDFYDFIQFPEGKLGIVVGDVTDKGVPAALVMATTRSILRFAAESMASPSEVLRRVNDLLCPDIPPNMFVTCLYAILDTQTGVCRFANAGHNLPFVRTPQGVTEMRATGMPLGLLPGMDYDEKETTILPGESFILYSDGLVEAHNRQGEMFGFPYLRELVCDHPGGQTLIPVLLDELSGFTGPGWEQEDDVTLVTVQREKVHKSHTADGSTSASSSPDQEWRTLADFQLASEAGNERLAMEKVEEAVKVLNLPQSSMDRLNTAVAEATMNAMEHGNNYQRDVPVLVRVLASSHQLSVRITDQSGDKPIPEHTAPDIEAKLAGLQSPRGWGLFLIQNMVDEMHVTRDERHHTIELIFNIEGEKE